MCLQITSYSLSILASNPDIALGRGRSTSSIFLPPLDVHDAERKPRDPWTPFVGLNKGTRKLAPIPSSSPSSGTSMSGSTGIEYGVTGPSLSPSELLEEESLLKDRAMRARMGCGSCISKGSRPKAGLGYKKPSSPELWEFELLWLPVLLADGVTLMLGTELDDGISEA